ncbi:MAG TPA: hypothetical protein VD886_16480 [Herpetosiphonaceae bacterium]|nr:hypothetical protein [Herpetosiphonaceae bacterium]
MISLNNNDLMRSMAKDTMERHEQEARVQRLTAQPKPAPAPKPSRLTSFRLWLRSAPRHS